MRRGPLLTAILWWTAFVGGVLVWLPLARGATQGAAYQWVLTNGVGGRGIGGDYWVLIFGAAFVFTLLYFGWRGGRQPFHWLLLTLHVPLAVAVVHAAWTDPQKFRFEGATIGLDIPLAVAGPILFGGFALGTIAWVASDLRARPSPPPIPWVWTRAARIRLAIALALVPLEAVLFRSGGIDSTQNLIGVALVGWQWILINRILAGARAA